MNWFTVPPSWFATECQASAYTNVDKFIFWIFCVSSVSAIYVCTQILAINRGENLKILTVKVNIPDGVKNEFCWWCVNERSAWIHILTEISFFYRQLHTEVYLICLVTLRGRIKQIFIRLDEISKCIILILYFQLLYHYAEKILP